MKEKTQKLESTIKEIIEQIKSLKQIAEILYLLIKDNNFKEKVLDILKRTNQWKTTELNHLTQENIYYIKDNNTSTIFQVLNKKR